MKLCRRKPPTVPVPVDKPTEINTWAVIYTADGKNVLSGDTKGVHVWRVDNEERIETLEVNGTVHCLAVSRDGKWIAAGTSWGDVIVWDAKTHKKVMSHRNDTSTIHAVDFSPDSDPLTRLVAASANRKFGASIWNVTTRKCVRTLDHENSVIAAKYAPRSDRLATATKSSVRVYDANDVHTLLEVRVLDIPVKVTSYYNTGLLWFNEKLVVLSDAGKIKKIEFSSTGSPSECEWLVPGVNYLPRGIVLSQKGEFIACTAHRTVTFWDTVTLTNATHTQPGPRVIKYHKNSDIHSVALSPDDRFIAIGGEGGEILIESLPPRVNVSIHDQGRQNELPSTSSSHNNTARTSIEKTTRGLDLDKPDRLSGESHRPGQGDPISRSHSPTRVNAVNEVFSRIFGVRREVLRRKLPTNDAITAGKREADTEKQVDDMSEHPPETVRIAVCLPITLRVPAWMLCCRSGTEDGIH